MGRQLHYEAAFVVEAAQVENKCAVLDVADDGNRQAAEGGSERFQTGAGALALDRPQGDAGAWQRLQRQGARADLARAIRHRYCVARTGRRDDGRDEAGSDNRNLGPRPREVAQRRQRRGEAVRVAVELEGRLEGGQADLVEAQRALHGVLGDARHKVLGAGDNARLRPAQQLVAGERDEVGAFGERLMHGRLGLQAVAREIHERPGTQIVHERHLARSRQGRQLRRRHRFGEALNEVVRRMRLEDQAGGRRRWPARSP